MNSPINYELTLFRNNNSIDGINFMESVPPGDSTDCPSKGLNDEWCKNGYIVVQNMIHSDLVEHIYREAKIMENSLEAHDKNRIDTILNNTLSYYSFLPGQALLVNLKSKIEQILNIELNPTYSYLRIYKNNSALPKHRDRNSCEISLSICISTDEIVFPLWLHSNEEDKEIVLDKGDAIIYKGDELVHWRDPFYGKEHVQLFLHYVDKNGKNAHLKYNNRNNIGIE